MGKAFSDKCVIYESAEDDCWIAHSLRTDQIGTGDCIVNSLVDLMRAVEDLVELAASDDTVQLERQAPPEIQRMFDEAKALPSEIFEIAHKMCYGIWPPELPIKLEPQCRNPIFSGQFTESARA